MYCTVLKYRKFLLAVTQQLTLAEVKSIKIYKVALGNKEHKSDCFIEVAFKTSFTVIFMNT